MTAMLDARGCLTDAALAALDKAPPGQGPPEAAAHLAACARCQRRFLARGGKDEAAISPVARTATPPPLWRTIAVVVAVIVLALTAMIGIRMLAAS
jgi:hypothetical protein